MVEGKTKPELATELGISVSTIGHGTLRIYQALSVSYRKGIAKKALLLSLIRPQHPQTLNPAFTLAHPID